MCRRYNNHIRHDIDGNNVSFTALATAHVCKDSFPDLNLDANNIF